MIVFWRSIQTPDKSRGENAACVFGTLRIGDVCAKRGSAKTKTAIRVRLARIHRPRNFTLSCPFKSPVTTSPRNTRIWRLSWFQSPQLITRFAKLRDSSRQNRWLPKRCGKLASLPANAQHRAECTAHYLVRRCRSEVRSRPGKRGYGPDSKDDQVDTEFFCLFQNPVPCVPGLNKCLRFAPQICFGRHKRFQAISQGSFLIIDHWGRDNVH